MQYNHLQPGLLPVPPRQHQLPGSQLGPGGKHLHARGPAGDKAGGRDQPSKARGGGHSATHVHISHSQELGKACELPVSLPDVRQGFVVDVVPQQGGNPEVRETVGLQSGLQLVESNIVRKAVSSWTSRVVNIVIEQTRRIKCGYV